VNRFRLRARAAAGALLILGLAAGMQATAPAQPAPDPSVIKVTACKILKPKPLSRHAGGTEIHFVNTGPVVLHSVEFTVTYQNANGPIDRHVEDDGRFAPNEPVDHKYSLFDDVDYAGTATRSCVVTAVR